MSGETSPITGEIARTVVTTVPPNAETHRRALASMVTRLDDFYIRSNFPVPEINTAEWCLTVRDLAGRETALSLDQLKAMAGLSRRLTLECAGNGRTLLDPKVGGTPWTLGGTSTGDFDGVPLKTVLDQLGMATTRAIECLFTGADTGERAGWGQIAFQRSLPIADALRSPDGPILVWAMNGAPLRPEHGAPVRLVVPGWYAVASVKWLTRVELLDQPFAGHFQTDKYMYRTPGETPAPVGRMKCRALILDPDPEASGSLESGPGSISGIAWSGNSQIHRVTVSTDGGASWTDAEFEPESDPFTPVRWQLAWDPPEGEHLLIARAHDSKGAQPLEQVWNELGYGNNVVQRCPVTVVAGVQPSSDS